MSNHALIPQSGQSAMVRNRPAVIEDVSASSPNGGGSYHFVTVRYIDGWQHPEHDRVIWEHETGAAVFDQLPWPDILKTKPDNIDQFHAFLDANVWSATNRLSESDKAEQVRLFSPWHNAIQIEDYQLYPVLKALLMPRVNLLLADDVGLGKTIEAGLVMSELLVRRRIRRVLIVCPASLQKQWQEEMQEKFHIDFTVVDRNSTFDLKRTLGMDSNPWSTYPRIITSQDYLRQRDVLESFEAATRRIGKRNEALLPWDLLIVDEAHNFTPSRFADDSERCKMLREIAREFEHRLFLTATPHNGYTLSFTGLLEMLDPVRFNQKRELDADDHEQKKLVMVRRLKSELNEEGGVRRFADRKLPESLELHFSEDERKLYMALRQYRKQIHNYLEHQDRREQQIGHFLTNLLTKRLLSSPYAFAWTWWQHVEGIGIGEVSTEEVAQAKQRAETAIEDDLEKDQRDQDAARHGGGWLSQFRGVLQEEMNAVGAVLEDMGWGADALENGLSGISEMPHDAKWNQIQRWLESNLFSDGTLRSDERLILFTEYKHSLDLILEQLKRYGLDYPQVETLFGGAQAAKREEVKAAFNDPQNPLRILVATDTAAEGINLQTSCRFVMHYEIPWNPMRLEQRNGRVDRHGQSRDVHVFHFTSADEDDLNFLFYVAEKVEQAREDLGSVGEVIDNAIFEHFTGRGVRTDDLDRRISFISEGAEEQADMQDVDHGGEQDYERVYQQMRATEMAMHLEDDRIARLLQTAVHLEGGQLEETDEDGIYQLRQAPPGWKRLVQETLEFQKGRFQGHRPKLAFDPEHFETVQDGLKVFQKPMDTRLIRLGHPLMKRAMGILQRALWEGDKVRRWTIAQSDLPAGIDAILILHSLFEVTNNLREKMHQQVLTIPFRIKGETLVRLDGDLWDEVKHLEKSALESAKLTTAQQTVREQWSTHNEHLKSWLSKKRSELEQEYTDKLEERYTQEQSRAKLSFQERLKELNKQSTQGAFNKLKRDLEKKREDLRQQKLFEEEQQRLEREVRELEWEFYHSHYNELKELLDREKDRMLNDVIPKRYSMASIQLQPMAVEYLVK